MIDKSYVAALAAAKMLTPTPAAKGIPVWRERGLITATLLLSFFVDRVQEFSCPVVMEHSFLMPARPYRRVFGEYGNTYMAEVPAMDGERVLRPDNLHASAARLGEASDGNPIIATGGLLRTLRGGAAELFRDRHIWPAIQGNHLVRRAEAGTVLTRWRHAVEATIAAAALPTVTIKPATESPYGRSSLLVLSCLPDGRPTVLATLYVLADRYRRRLGISRDVIDVGFTGKVVAVAAMHHRDHRGLTLPSAIAPLQAGIVAAVGDAPAADAWLGRLSSSGIRARIVTVKDSTSSRWRAEHRLHREAAPLVIGTATGALVRRMPLRRAPMPAAGDVSSAVAAELAAHDRRLAARSMRRLERGFCDSGLLRYMCPACAETAKPPLSGWVVPRNAGACTSCGRAGRQALLSDAERFY